MARYIIYYEGENNGYDDSDFYYMAIDTKENTIVKHVYASTRHAGFSPLEDSEKKVGCSFYLDHARSIAIGEINHNMMYDNGSYEPWPDDEVRVSNPKARKHKDVIFKLDHKFKYKPWYPETAVGYTSDGEKIKTAVKNLSIIFLGTRHFEYLISKRIHG